MLQIRRGFTIVELLGAAIVISIALLSILSLLRIAVSYTNKSRQETIAINLTREGMEEVYSRRNTNWLKRSGKKDEYWLCAKDSTIPGECEYRFYGGYTLHRLGYQTGAYGKSAYYEKKTTLANLETSILGDTNLLLTTGDFIGGVSPDAAGNFYRAVIGIGLYQKDTNITGGRAIICTKGDTFYNGTDIGGNAFNSSCSDSHAKEFRFCSRVEYKKEFEGKVELCGGITNYQE